MNARFANSTAEDYLTAVKFLCERSAQAAQGFIERVEEALDQLELFPNSGSYIPEFPETQYRQVFARPYRLFYRVEDDTILITALYHDRQQPTEPEK